MTPIHFVVYFTALVFIIAILRRAIRIAKMPIHLRWELYPVPHEKGRAHYGGSILEETDWWTKEHHKDHIGELFVMLQEIILLKGVWEHNRRLWLGTFPLHFGLYLLIGNMALLILAGIKTTCIGGTCFIYNIIPIIAWIGSILGAIGAVVMLLMRMFDPGLSKFSTPSHYFNLVVLGGIYITGLIWLSADSSFFTNISGFYASLIFLIDMPSVPLIGHLHIGFSIFFIFYLPFTHMTHFFTKYFTYHSVRWEDETNRPGDPLQKRLDPQLAQIVTWAAPHVGADGKKNWVDIVTSPVPEIKKEKK